MEKKDYTDNQYLQGLFEYAKRHDRHLSAIKGWITFFGILTIFSIGLSLVYLFLLAASLSDTGY